MPQALTALRVLRSLAVCGNDRDAAESFARASRWADRDAVVDGLKDAVGGHDLSSLDGQGDARVDLLATLRPLTLVGRLPLHRVPPLVPMLTQVTGAVGSWAGEGKARRMSVGTYARDSLKLLSVTALTVATNELLAAVAWDGENALLDDLLAACVQALDEAFIDPGNAGDAATPAAVTADAVPIVSGGFDPAALDADLKLAIAALSAAGSDLRRAHWITSPDVAVAIGLLRGTGGAPAYPGLGAMGGGLAGLPVLTTGAVLESSDGHILALVDAGQLAYAEGVPDLRTSQHASIEMSTTPTGDTLTPAKGDTELISLFQAESTALLATFKANWKPRRDGMVQLISGLDIDGGSV